MSALDLIHPLRPCAAAVEWLTAGAYPDLRSAWDACPRADWMIWLVVRGRSIDRINIIRAAAAIARDVLPSYELTYPSDVRPRRAVEAVEAWCDDPMRERTSVVRAWTGAHNAVKDAIHANAKLAAYAADAATRAAGAAAWRDVDVAWAAADAAWIVVSTDAAAQRRHADIVRRFLPNPPEML